MKIHIIGIGECIMGDLAATLSRQGHTITGSDVTFSPTTSTSHGLKHTKLMPAQSGWSPQKIQPDLDKVIVGRQIQPDNPELQVARKHGLPIYTYPEYIYDYAKDKQRIVIVGGAHTNLIHALVLHVLAFWQRPYDYVVSTSVQTTRVKLSDAPIIILESDMEPVSWSDPQPQSLCYQHNMALIASSAWVPTATYTTYEHYLAQLTRLADASPKGGTLIYDVSDHRIRAMVEQVSADIKKVPYQASPHRYESGKLYLTAPQQAIIFPYTEDPLSLHAIAGAQQLLRNLAIVDKEFYEALAEFPPIAQATTLAT